MLQSFKGLSLLLTFLLASLITAGQQTFLRNYTVDDGLPSSETYHVIQDSKGYIWIATNQGVSRFDGKTFRNFDIQKGIPENTVFEIYEDDLKRLWFVNYPFQLSYFFNDTIYQYKYNELLRDLAGHGLVPIKKSFSVDADNNIFFSFINNDKSYKLSKTGELSVIDQIQQKEIALIIREIDHQLISAQSKNRSNQSIIKIILDGESRMYAVNTVSNKGFSYGHFTAEVTNNNEILYAQNEILAIINAGKITSHRLKERILWVSSTKDSSVWIGMEFSGVQKYNLDNFENGPIDEILNGKSVSSILVDREGGEWFTTLETGLFYRPNKAFTSYTPEDGLSGVNITAVDEFNNKIFVGTGNGFLNVIDNGIFTESFNFGKKVVKIISYPDKAVYIGTDAYLYKYENGNYITIWNNHRLISQPELKIKYLFSIKDLLLLNENEIYMGQMRSFTQLSNNNVIYDSYLDDSIAIRVESIAKINDDHFLLGTFTGLWQYSERKFTFLGNENKLLNQRITDILIIHNPDYQLLGTKGSGLIVKKGKQIYQITQNEGLTSNSITSLLRTNNEIWIATNDGLNMIPVKDLESKYPFIRVFKKEQGLISNEINEIKSVKNKLYIAANGGLTILDRSLYKPAPTPPPVYLEKISIDGQVYKASDEIILTHDQKFLKIYFSGIDFRDASNLKFRYRLVGIDDVWSTTDNSEVDYSFLPSGNYRFEVMGVNSEWHISPPTVLYIKVKPPFWETWWFFLLTFIFVIALIYLIVRISVQRVRKQHSLQNDIYKYRQEALIKQMDPHFVFNTLNSIQSFILRNDTLSSSQYLTKFSRLMRLILNNSQKKAVTLREEIEALSLYMELEAMRFTRKFIYSINVEPDVDTEIIKIPAFILQPFIENSIWHGIMNLDREGKISLDFKKMSNYFTIIIEDNGVGRKKAEEIKLKHISDKKSLGLSIVESRLELLWEAAGIPPKLEFTDLYDEAGEPNGTRIIFNLPILK